MVESQKCCRNPPLNMLRVKYPLLCLGYFHEFRYSVVCLDTIFIVVVVVVIVIVITISISIVVVDYRSRSNDSRSRERLYVLCITD